RSGRLLAHAIMLTDFSGGAEQKRWKRESPRIARITRIDSTRSTSVLACAWRGTSEDACATNRVVSARATLNCRRRTLRCRPVLKTFFQLCRELIALLVPHEQRAEESKAC